MQTKLFNEPEKEILYCLTAIYMWRLDCSAKQTIAALDYHCWSQSYFDLLDKLCKPHIRSRSTQAIPEERE